MPKDDKQEKVQDKFKIVFDVSTGKEKRVKLTEEELATLEPTVPPEPEVDPALELIYEIDNAMTLAELKRIMVKMVSPEIANERKMR